MGVLPPLKGKGKGEGQRVVCTDSSPFFQVSWQTRPRRVAGTDQDKGACPKGQKEERESIDGRAGPSKRS